MKRRLFLQAISVIAGSIPFISCARKKIEPETPYPWIPEGFYPEPTTVAELYTRANEVFKPMYFISTKKFERVNGKRYDHVTYGLMTGKEIHPVSGSPERRLVRSMWRTMIAKRDQHKSKKPMLFWRRIPVISDYKNLISGEDMVKITARFSII